MCAINSCKPDCFWNFGVWNQFITRAMPNSVNE